MLINNTCITSTSQTQHWPSDATWDLKTETNKQTNSPKMLRIVDEKFFFFFLFLVKSSLTSQVTLSRQKKFKETTNQQTNKQTKKRRNSFVECLVTLMV